MAAPPLRKRLFDFVRPTKLHRGERQLSSSALRTATAFVRPGLSGVTRLVRVCGTWFLRSMASERIGVVLLCVLPLAVIVATVLMGQLTHSLSKSMRKAVLSANDLVAPSFKRGDWTVTETGTGDHFVHLLPPLDPSDRSSTMSEGEHLLSRVQLYLGGNGSETLEAKDRVLVIEAVMMTEDNRCRTSFRTGLRTGDDGNPQWRRIDLHAGDPDGIIHEIRSPWWSPAAWLRKMRLPGEIAEPLEPVRPSVAAAHAIRLRNLKDDLNAIGHPLGETIGDDPEAFAAATANIEQRLKKIESRLLGTSGMLLTAISGPIQFGILILFCAVLILELGRFIGHLSGVTSGDDIDDRISSHLREDIGALGMGGTLVYLALSLTNIAAGGTPAESAIATAVMTGFAASAFTTTLVSLVAQRMLAAVGLLRERLGDVATA